MVKEVFTKLKTLWGQKRNHSIQWSFYTLRVKNGHPRKGQAAYSHEEKPYVANTFPIEYIKAGLKFS